MTLHGPKSVLIESYAFVAVPENAVNNCLSKAFLRWKLVNVIAGTKRWHPSAFLAWNLFPAEFQGRAMLWYEMWDTDLGEDALKKRCNVYIARPRKTRLLCETLFGRWHVYAKLQVWFRMVRLYCGVFPIVATALKLPMSVPPKASWLNEFKEGCGPMYGPACDRSKDSENNVRNKGGGQPVEPTAKRLLGNLRTTSQHGVKRRWSRM